MDAPPPEDRDCLICFGTLRRPTWQQPTVITCECRPALHRACWEAWAAQAGPICIICRSNKYYPRLPPMPPQPHENDHAPGILLFGYRVDRCTAALIFCGTFYVLLVFYHAIQPENRRLYSSDGQFYRHPMPYRTEL